MPFAIDEEKLTGDLTLDLSRQQGTMGGLPVKMIQHKEFPKCVYKHPNAPFYEEVHRNANHEVVHRELKATEHQVYVCHDAQEYKKKLSQGWVDKPYIAQAPPDPTEQLYKTPAPAPATGSGSAASN